MGSRVEPSYCVIGDPVAQTLSPAIHRMVYEELGLSIEYHAVRVAPGDLAAFVSDTRTRQRPGFNVTIPHKETIVPLLDELDSVAGCVGAVNTVLNEKARLIGFNTDVIGARVALADAALCPGSKALLLGAGGAARTVLHVLGEFRVRHVAMHCRSASRAESLCREFGRRGTFDVSVVNEPARGVDLAGIDLLINSTPVGMWPKVDESPLADLRSLPQSATVFDMVPRPLVTRLLRDARSRGARIVPGMRMLIAQALAAAEIWLGRKMPDGLFDKIWSSLIREGEIDGTA
ncbi:MAG: shikimate dehydrogenase [Acidobacteriota bacterium]